MNTYEVTLPGFQPDTDATDHLVRWVRAPSQELVQARYPTGTVRRLPAFYDTVPVDEVIP